MAQYFVGLALALALGSAMTGVVVGCSSASSAKAVTAQPMVSASASPRTREPKHVGLATPGSPFEFVLSGDEALRIAPLGDSAILIVGSPGHGLLLMDEVGIRAVPGLNQFFHLSHDDGYLTVLGGHWPNDVWLAQNAISDAGSDRSWVFKWRAAGTEPLLPPGWVLKWEPAMAVEAIFTWRGGTVFANSHGGTSDPMLVSRELTWWSGDTTKALSSPGATGDKLPWTTTGNSFTVFNLLNQGPEYLHAAAPLIEVTGREDGKLKHRLISVPDGFGEGYKWQLFVEGEDRLLLDSRVSAAAPLLWRLEGERWVSSVVPEQFNLVDAPGSSRLWGVAQGQLMYWQADGWKTVGEIPTHGNLSASERGEAEEWSVWQRDVNDIWLLTKRGALYHTAGGTVRDSSLFLEVLMGQQPWAVTPDHECPEMLAEVLALRPSPVNAPRPQPLSTNQARARLQTALEKHPEFQKYSFVRYDCFGEDCIGGLVPNREVAEALQVAVQDSVYSTHQDMIQCGARPSSQPFKL